MAFLDRNTTSAQRPRAAQRPRRLAPWAIAAWLAVWQLASMALGSALLLPGPLDVCACLVALVPTAAFWQRVCFSLARIAVGFALGAITGVLGAFAAARWRRADELLAPFMALAQSVPVASITVLALIWLRAANLAVLVVLLVVLPLVYENVRNGLRATDRSLDDMAALFALPAMRRMRFLVLPQLYPYLSAALTTALGMAWKAGVAAEVIGIPAGSLGEAIYDAKIYFDTAGLFAVTLAVVLASALTTQLVRLMLAAAEPLLCAHAGHTRAYESYEHASSNDAANAREYPASSLAIRSLSKTYDSHPILSDLSFTTQMGTPVVVMAPSGTGKTTLLRMIAGLEAPDTGSITMEDDPRWQPRVSMVFQDDRLANQASALANVRLPLERDSSAWEEAPKLLEQLGLSERLHAPVGTCSGGERRRIALARALLAPHDILLLDEPFAGLDTEAHEHTAALIRAREERRIVIVASHDAYDAQLLGARIMRLP